LPETLDEAYERTLREINKADWELTHRLFQCVAVASRPLRVEELAEFLAFDFQADQIPTFHEGWRPEDPVDVVLSTCPSFLAVVNVGDSRIIQFSHYSVKEFLTSARLAETKHEISRYHVSITLAQTLAARACLGILLHPDKSVTEDGPQQSPLARYAALHWVDHARFQDVSRTVKDGMNNLFDPSRPHLASWVSLYNKELPLWKPIKRGERTLPLNGTPMYYAIVCGLHAFVKALVVEQKHDVDSRCFDNLTPLQIASLSGQKEVARVLLDCNADVAGEDEDRRTPLHLASKEGHSQVVRILLERGAPTMAQDKDGSTPLHLALQARRVEAIAEEASQIDFLSYMISHSANFQAARELADEIDQGEDGSPSSHVEVARLLVEHGSDVSARDEKGWTPLHSMSLNGRMDLARFLVEHGADVAALDKKGWTPLHLASNVEVAQFLVDHGADATSQRENGWNPLHSASKNGHVDVARFLVEHGADTTAYANDWLTPLHLASSAGHMDVVRYLVECGADASAQKDGRTPLHLASFNGHVQVARFLVGHGADATTQMENGSTPLYMASITGQVEVAQFLVEHGADVSAKQTSGLGMTPLHLATFHGHERFVRFLLAHGADTEVRCDAGFTPWDFAAQQGHVELMRILNPHSTIAQRLVSPFLIVVFNKRFRVVVTLLVFSALHDIDL
jgi:ankyrin repeat protein